jgi:glutathione S-transferase
VKLYYSPLACSFSVDIALREAGMAFELERVDTKTKKTAGGRPYLEINPKGYVPALELDDGSVITEAAAVLQYVADQSRGVALAPPEGRLDRIRVQEWLNWTASELHKCFTPLFDPKLSDERKQEARTQVARWLDFLDGSLEGREFLVGKAFSIADAYCYAVLNWTRFTGIALDGHPRVAAYLVRTAERPAVKEALAEETRPA